jgi:transcriptional repressor NrdR
MTCPFCGHRQDRVIDSRETKDGEVVRRRRECLKCQRRFTTYERSDEIPYMVVKRDGRREKFDRHKVLEGLLKACEKRPVPMAKLAEVVDEVESKLGDHPEREIPTTQVGEVVLKRLQALDKIAYVRFASVYKDFQDVEAFLAELKELVQRRN